MHCAKASVRSRISFTVGAIADKSCLIWTVWSVVAIVIRWIEIVMVFSVWVWVGTRIVKGSHHGCPRRIVAGVIIHVLREQHCVTPRTFSKSLPSKQVLPDEQLPCLQTCTFGSALHLFPKEVIRCICLLDEAVWTATVPWDAAQTLTNLHRSTNLV